MKLQTHLREHGLKSAFFNTNNIEQNTNKKRLVVLSYNTAAVTEMAETCKQRVLLVTQ